MKLLKIILILSVLGILSATAVFAEDNSGGVELEGVEVKAKEDKGLKKEKQVEEEKDFEGDVEEQKGLVEKKKGAPETESTVTREALDVLATPAQTDIYKAFELLPSVEAQTVDPYGLIALSPWNFRVRGELGIRTGFTVDGVPVYQGMEPPGPRPDIFDIENFASETLYRGAIPSDKGLGGQDIAGAIEARILGPADKFGLTLHESAGAFDFNRTFVRLDTGKLPTGTKLYLSYSYTGADKWRGLGGSPGYRDHVSLGVSQEFSSMIKAELFTDFNNQVHQMYRGLTYAQASNLNQYRFFDFNRTLTETPSQDIFYYGFNWMKDRDYNVFANIEIRPNANNLITFKPYYWSGYRPHYTAYGMILGQPGIDGRTNDMQRYGEVLEYKTKLLDTALTFGYWAELYADQMPEKIYRATSGALTFDRWLLAKYDGDGLINSPYFKAEKTIGNLHAVAGLRYYYLSKPGQTGYSSAGLPDISYSNVFNYNPAVDPGASYRKADYHAWLPNVGLDYQFTKNINAYLNYGRNYAMPTGSPELQLSYAQSRTAFNNAGQTIQHLADMIKIETADDYDLGMRYDKNSFYIAPTVFYSISRNKWMAVFDPTIGQLQTQSVGKTRSYGAELEAGLNLMDNLAAFTGLSYDISEMAMNIQTASSTVLNVKGNQLPDAPKFMGKLGATYKIWDFKITPDVEYMGSRYGDVTNLQKVSPYTVVNLNLDYTRKEFLGLREFDAGVSALNLLDKKYIGMISAFDFSQMGMYYPGAPFTIAGTISARY